MVRELPILPGIVRGPGWGGGWLAALGVLAGATLTAGEPRVTRSEGFELHPDLRIALFASEPDVLDPVSVSFDEQGRLYVAEMRDYPYGIGPEHAVGGAVRLLEDRDGDGRAERSVVFAEGLRFPTSVLACRGGVLVTAAPDILFLKDTDGDGRADLREVVLTGFKLGVTDSNLNGLRWGLDNWVHVANGGNGGRITSPKRPGVEPVSLGDRDLRFRSDTGEFELTAHTGGGFGIVFDDWGRSFTTYNINHLQQRVADADDFLRVQGMPTVETTQSISDHGDMARIYPISEAVTRPNHPEQAGHFSAAGGMGWMGHRGWPETLRGGVLVCDVVGNLVHRDVLVPEGPIFRGTRAPEESAREFLASRDPHFRPVGLEQGPDGALYLIDMQRAVIEHPDYIPKKLLEKLDLREGSDRGRIYRIWPRAWGDSVGNRESWPGRVSALERVGLLASANPWVRGTAQRLLVERKEREAVPRLARIATGEEHLGEGPTRDLARLHAAWALEGLGALTDAVWESLLQAELAELRESAVEMARARLGTSARVAGLVKGRLQDPTMAVRFRAALASSSAGPVEVPLLAAYWQQDHGHRWSRQAGWAATGTQALAVLQALIEVPAFREGSVTSCREALRELAELALAVGGSLEEGLALATRAGVSDAASAAMVEGMERGAARRGGERPVVTGPVRANLNLLEHRESVAVRTAAWRLAARLGEPASEALRVALQEASRVAMDMASPLEARTRAIRVLELGTTAETAPGLLRMLDGAQPGVVQEAAFAVLRERREAEVGRGLMAAWSGLAPALRPSVVNLLVYRHGFHEALLEALESGSVQVGELNLDLEHRRELLRKATKGIRERAAKFTSDEEYSNRGRVVEQWLGRLPKAGDAAKGRVVFERLCAPCHVAEGVGHAVGPELTRQNHRSVEDLLSNILDPNMAMNPAFVAFTAELTDGEQETGILSAENAVEVTLLQALGRKVDIPRSRVKQLRSNGKSLMPEGLESGLTPAELRDLIAFVQEGTRAGAGGAP
ncbi:MAG: c-type cytochrome [Verrucomicrobiales bacterium]|nr:c-type cytochrome [Verrucomicrobiales bacterium]